MVLSSPLTVQPYDFIGDPTGRPLNKGRIYIGEANKDPEFYPIPVYFDQALTKEAIQPIRTNNGFVDFAGDLTELYASEEIYSVKILDEQGRKIVYKGAMMRNNLTDDVIVQINAAIVASIDIARQVATDITNEVIIGSADIARQVATDITNEAINNTAVEGGVLADTFVTVTANGTGMVARTQRDKNSDVVSVKDFGAVGDGVAQDASAWHAFEDSHGARLVPEGKYVVGSDVKEYPYGGFRIGEMRISDVGWDKEKTPVYARSTPQTATVSLGGIYDLVGAAGRNYKWGLMAYHTNPNTAPTTGIASIVQGYKVRALEATSRQCGDDGDAHSFEIMSGQYSSKASVTTVSGSNTLTVKAVTFDGSKFCVGNEIKGNNIPLGAKIVSVSKDSEVITGRTVEYIDIVDGGQGYNIGDIVTVTGGESTFPAYGQVRTVSSTGVIYTILVVNAGNYTTPPSGEVTLNGGSGFGATARISTINGGLGYPDTIVIDNPATSNSSSTNIEVFSTDTQQIGMLVTGSGDGGSDGKGNPNGRAIQVQSYGDAAFLYGVNFGQTSLRPEGTGVRFSLLETQYGVRSESSNFESFIRLSGGTHTNLMAFSGATCSGATISYSGVTAPVGIAFPSSNVFTTAAILLNGQDIASDTDIGMRLATNPLQKIGFFGKTPIVRPAAIAVPSGGSTIDEEARAAIIEIRNALRGLGLIAT